MIRPSPAFRRFEAGYDRETGDTSSIEARLTRFAALWAHTRLLNPDLGGDWVHDLEADLAVARAVNGLPPA